MALALDGSAHGNAVSASSLGVSLSTSGADRIVIVCVTLNNGTVSSISDDDANTWNFHASDTTDNDIEVWYAVASGQMTSNTITVNHSGTGYMTVDTFGISGADQSTVFDANASTPHVEPAADAAVISTDTADTFIFSAYRASSPASPAGAGGDWIKISGADFQLVQYQIVSSTQTDLTCSIGTGTMNGGVASAVIIAAGGLSIPIAAYHYNHNIGSNH